MVPIFKMESGGFLNLYIKVQQLFLKPVGTSYLAEWFILTVIMPGSGITLEETLWACLWDVFYIRLNEVKIPTHNVSSALPWTCSLKLHERENAGWAQTWLTLLPDSRCYLASWTPPLITLPSSQNKLCPPHTSSQIKPISHYIYSGQNSIIDSNKRRREHRK